MYPRGKAIDKDTKELIRELANSSRTRRVNGSAFEINCILTDMIKCRANVWWICYQQ